MTQKTITNPSQAFSNGTWGNPPIENETTMSFAWLLNGTGAILYVGDVVCLDVTGQQALFGTAANDPTFIGVVGSGTAGDFTPSGSSPLGIGTVFGENAPMVLSPNRQDSVGVTSTSATVTDTSSLLTVADIGKTVSLPNGSSNFLTTILTVTPGTGFTIATAYPGSTGTVNAQIYPSPSSLGPGYPPITYAPNSVVPIITEGYCRINIAALTTVTAKGFILTASSGSGIATATALGSATAAQAAGLTGIPLEAYAARDLTLTNAGIAGHETVRAMLS